MLLPLKISQLPWLIFGVSLLTGCEQVADRAGFPDPARVEADGKAIGGGCRHAGRGLEDCYQLNKEASKAAIYKGWREMNEYMVKNGIQAVTPLIPPEALTPVKPKKKKKTTDEATDEGVAEGKTEAGAEEKTTEKATEAEPSEPKQH